MTDSQEDPLSSKDVVLFPAYNIGNSELYYFLRSIENYGLSHRVLTICTADFASEYGFPSNHLIIDNFDSLPALVGKVESWRKRHTCGFAGIIGIDEELQFRLSKRLARRFGLEFFDDKTCFLASNKFLQKTSYLEHGVSTSRFELISKFDRESALRVGFPNVLKVLSGTQSQYIFYNEDMDALKNNYNLLSRAVRDTNGDPRFRKQNLVIDGQCITLDPKRQFLIESYIPGEEFSCDFIVQSNTIQIVRVTRKIHGPYFGYFKGYHLLNEEGLVRNKIDKSELVAVLRKIQRALHIHTGVCMVDFKIHCGTIAVLEASIRPGLSAFNHLMYDVYGYTSLALMAMQKMGIPIRVGLPDAHGAVLYIYSSPDGMFGTFDTPEIEILNHRLDITATHMYRDAQDCAVDSDIDHSMLLRGYVVLRESDKAFEAESAGLVDTGTSYHVVEPIA